MNTTSALQFLSQQDFEALDSLLDAASPESAMLVEEFDGFCVAAATSPLPVSEQAVLDEALGASSAEALDRIGGDAHGRLITLLTRHYRGVRQRLHEAHDFEAVIGRDETGRSIAEPWAAGYLRGLNLRPEGWDPIEDDEVCVEALDLILRFAAESNPSEIDVEPIAEEEREDLIDQMIEGVLEIYTRLAPAREQALKPATFRKAAAGPGRNDPCHCGSGRKFKHCHGR
jgi:uncharacterized protein